MGCTSARELTHGGNPTVRCKPYGFPGSRRRGVLSLWGPRYQTSESHLSGSPRGPDARADVQEGVLPKELIKALISSPRHKAVPGEHEDAPLSCTTVRMLYELAQGPDWQQSSCCIVPQTGSRSKAPGVLRYYPRPQGTRWVRHGCELWAVNGCSRCSTNMVLRANRPDDGWDFRTLPSRFWGRVFEKSAGQDRCDMTSSTHRRLPFGTRALGECGNDAGRASPRSETDPLSYYQHRKYFGNFPGTSSGIRQSVPFSGKLEK